MEISAEDFHSSLLERVLEILWSQWSAVGIYTGVPPSETIVIDPEALVCATMWFGRYSPRLFDEAMDWMKTNDALVSLDRLKSIARLFSSDTAAVLGAVFDHLWMVERRTKFRAKSLGREKEQEKNREPLFRSWPDRGEPTHGDNDEIFLRWGFERSPVELRGMSSVPALGKAVNLRFVLRDLFGLGVRAEVAAYLTLEGQGNSSQIAKAVTQNQRAVYAVLGDLARGGFARKRETGRETIFTIDTGRWRGFIEHGTTARFVQWADIFSALQGVLVDKLENDKAYGSAYLASSRFREIAPEVTRRLANAGLDIPIPNPSNYPGEEYNGAFSAYIFRSIDALIDLG
ncbi:MAG: hypothetical protein ACYC99_11010 [Candidatus Geothermincolia bacterium]